jgi:hypothetical protein
MINPLHNVKKVVSKNSLCHFTCWALSSMYSPALLDNVDCARRRVRPWQRRLRGCINRAGKYDVAVGCRVRILMIARHATTLDVKSTALISGRVDAGGTISGSRSEDCRV